MVLTATQLLELRNNSQKIIEENKLLILERDNLIKSISAKTHELDKLNNIDNLLRVKNAELGRLRNEVDDCRNELQKIKTKFLLIQKECLEEERRCNDMRLKTQEEYKTLNNIKQYKEQFV